MPATENVHNTHNRRTLRLLHSAMLDIVLAMIGPQRDEMMVREAGIALDRALFPLLVLVERWGPIGVVDLAERIGRDHSTVSRQLGKLEAQGLIARNKADGDKRVRAMAVTAAGKAMTDRIDATRERLLREGFASWSTDDVDTLARLMRRLADGMKGEGEAPGTLRDGC